MRFLVIFLIIVLSLCLLPDQIKSNQSYSINHIRTIGDDVREDQFFINITAGIISPDLEIFIGDTGGKFISKYSWEGNLIKRIGQAGQGPGDFLSVKRFSFLDSKLVTYDIHNRRICLLNFSLGILGYIKFFKPMISGNLLSYKNNSFICSFSNLRSSKGKGKIGFIDTRGNLYGCFFPQNQFGKISSPKNELEWALDMMTNKLLIGYCQTSDIVLAGFEYPAVPAEFFLFNSQGKKLKSFTLNSDNKLIFPEYKRHFPLEIPSTPVHYLVVTSILSHKSNFLIFTNIHKTGKDVDMAISSTCHVISDTTVQQGKIEVPTGSRFFNITEDGYLIGKNDLDEIPQVHIWKLTQKGNE